MLALVVPALWGFSSAAMFDEPASVGGGGGYAFTGSPTSHGLSCLSCHQARPHGDGVDLWSVPAGLLDRGWEPGQRYEVHVHLLAEERGLDHNGNCPLRAGGCNRNGFVAEFLGEGGVAPVGTLCVDGGEWDKHGACATEAGTTTAMLAGTAAVSGTSLASPELCGPGVSGDCIDAAAMGAAGKSEAEITRAILAAVRGRTTWSFQWRAPGPEVTAARLWLGLVDGDGSVGADPAHNDYRGDSVYLLQRTLWARGYAPASVAPGGGCVAALRGDVPAGSLAGWWLGLALAALALGAGRRENGGEE